MKTKAVRVDTDPKSTTELPISTIRGMCSGINADVPNDAENPMDADHLIASKAAERVASVKRARKITLDDL